jgi:DNA polymerase I-like protein with 3'-5' exonuclease and polymerase domains
MMDIVTIDFETYYDKDYSLSKMTTEQYVRSPLFEIIGVGIKVNDYPTDWYSGGNPGKFLKSLDYRNRAILCHNTAFDGAILSWHFGIKPRLWLDTLSMARPLHNVTVGGSLAKLVTYYGLGKKGDEVVAALGKHKADFAEADLAQYGQYCINDVNLTKQLFDKMKVGFPSSELLAIDQTLRMYTEPTIELDVPLLEAHLEEVRTRKRMLIQDLGLSGVSEEALTKMLMSNDIFAKYLKNLGIEPPRKVSLTTGKETWAFAKTDKGMTDLLEHPDERVQSVVAARLGVKSTIEETRTDALIGVAGRGRLPIMLNYYGAHTGRFSGGDKLNLQNLPARGNTTIRRALKAPTGELVIACDSSQIEARTVAWVAGQEDLLEAFREKRDVYSEFASEVYGRKVTKADKVERFVGKTCIAEGTLVLSQQGWKPIESVTSSDLLWDGEEWVCHQGLLNNGIKPTLNLCGAWLTPDHQVWSGTQWLEAQSVVADEDTLYQVLDTGAENLPSQATWLAPEVESVPSLCGATATPPNIRLTRATSKISAALAALFVPRQRRLQNAIGCTAKQWQMMSTGLAYSIVSLQQSLGVTHQRVVCISTTEDVVSVCTPSGDRIVPRSYGMSKPLTGGIDLISRWIGSMWTGTMNRAISASYRAAITSATSAKSQTLKRVYDISNCGSRNRFTILTEAGPVIVHNCVLGLGYGMGAEKFRRTLEIGQAGISVKIDINEAERIVRLYRQKNWKIVQFWQKCGNALKDILYGGENELHPQVRYDKKGIRLPNGFYIQYPALRETASGFMYISDARTYQKAIKDRVLTGSPPEDIAWTKVYGGKVTENIVQALAAIVIREQMAAIGQHHHVAFQVHDEIIITSPADTADAAEQKLVAVMSTPPKWAPDLPVACESGKASTYGDT